MYVNLIGQMLGKYRILEEIGRGGMGVVYLAHDTVLDRRVAIKVLAPALTADPEAAQRFLIEARAAARLAHPHIVTVHDVGQAEGYSFIVMQYLEGRTLAQILKQEGPLPPARAAYLVSQVADALDHAHAHGFIHRDVKPGNILVDVRDQATLTDFGVARSLGGTRLTRTGAIIGTPAYMAPEQIKGEPVGPAADIYSLGVVTYEMVGGRAPFEGTTTQVMLAHLNELPPPLPQINPRIPQTVASVVHKVLAKTPGDRYQSATAFAAALRQAVESRTTDVKPTGTPPADQKKPRKSSRARLFVICCLVLLGLCSLCSLVLVLTRSSWQLGLGGTPGSTRTTLAGTPSTVIPTRAGASPTQVSKSTSSPVVAPGPWTPKPLKSANVLFSDSFNRADADRCALGRAGLDLGGNGPHYYLPIFPSGGTDGSNPIGANIVSNALQNNGADFGGVQFTASSAPCSNGRGEDIGQDMNIRVNLLVPSDSSGHTTQAGPYFRSRAAGRGDGIMGGASAGYWVQLYSTGEVKVKRLNPQSFVAFTGAPASFDNTVLHTLEIAAQGNSLQVALDEQLLTFNQDGNLMTTVSIPATSGSNNGCAGIAFGDETNRGQMGGQRADNLMVTAFRSLADLPTQNNFGAR